MILRCDCKANSSGNPKAAEYQDMVYGKGMRVHNPLPKQLNAPQKARCSVCGKTNTRVGEVVETGKGKGKGKK